MLTIRELVCATQGRLLCGRNDLHVKGISTDSRTVCKKEAFVALKGPAFDGHNFINKAVQKGATCVIKEKGRNISLKSVAVIEVSDGARAYGDIANWQRRKYRIPVIAVTGSNGKTSTKEMVAWLLSSQWSVLKNEGTKNNHIGVPQTLLKLKPSHDIAVLELGTNHPGEIGYLAQLCEPTVGVITNIGLSHLEFLGDLEGVYKEKYTLIEELQKPAIALLNADDLLLRRVLRRKNPGCVKFGFGIKNSCEFRASEIMALFGTISFCLNAKHKVVMNALGTHVVYNALAAIAVARLFGMEYEAIARRLACFELPQGRLVLMRGKKATFIDDTYNANPLSLAHALEVLASAKSSGRKIFILGDMLELGTREEMFHLQAGQGAAQVCDILVAVGKRSQSAAKAAKIRGLKENNIFICATAAEAREILANEIIPTPDDIVLVKGSRGMNMEEVLKI